MKKKMLAFAAVALVAASYSAIARPLPGAPAAQESLASQSRAGANNVQQALFSQFIAHQSMLLAQATNDDQSGAVILANNVAWMWILSPAQQEAEKRDTLQLDKYRPGSGPWDAVRKAPSKVKHLLSLTKEQDAAILSIRNAGSDPFLEVARSNRTYVEKTKAHWKNAEAESEAIRKVLNAEQKKEWDDLRKAGLRLQEDAFNSTKP